jgi:hypothetical protein
VSVPSIEELPFFSLGLDSSSGSRHILISPLDAAKESSHGYVISRQTGIDVIPEAEKQAAIAELNEMGYEVEVLPNRRIRQTRRADAPPQDRESLRKTTPRMMSLIHSLHGTRQRYEILAKSKEF